jgi:hypothetical protein
MKALYALVLVCMSIPAFAASTDTLEDSTATHHPIYLDDLDYLDITGETVAQATTRVPGIVIGPAIETETLVFELDGTENYNNTDSVPGMTTILPDDEDQTGSFADPWGGY